MACVSWATAPAHRAEPVELGDSAGDSVVDALGSIAASECGAVSQEVQHVDQDVAVVLVPVDLVDRPLPGRGGRHAHTDWTAPGDRREHACVDPGPDGWRRDAQDVSGVRDLRPGGSVSDMVSEAEKAPAPRCIAFLRCELLELDQVLDEVNRGRVYLVTCGNVPIIERGGATHWPRRARPETQEPGRRATATQLPERVACDRPVRNFRAVAQRLWVTHLTRSLSGRGSGSGPYAKTSEVTGRPSRMSRSRPPTGLPSASKTSPSTVNRLEMHGGCTS